MMFELDVITCTDVGALQTTMVYDAVRHTMTALVQMYRNCVDMVHVSINLVLKVEM